jgi:c-di-GMP-binding flagellar brake protein YcgR
MEHEIERRLMPRCDMDEAATLLVVASGVDLRCRIVELSLGGCRMILEQQVPIGLHTGVEASFKVRGIAFRLSGETGWSDGARTVGVSFSSMTTRRRADLLEVFAEMEAAKAAREEEEAAAAAGIGAQKLPAAPNAEQNPPAVSPAAQKPPATQMEAAPASKAAAQELQPTADAETAAEAVPPPAPIPERRKYARYAVEQSAVIYLVKVGSKLPGQVLNLSLGGCRVRTKERFPVGIYTRVEIEFRMQGQLVRLGGVIQAIYGRHEVGVRFLDVSLRKLNQLAELIEEMYPTGQAEGSSLQASA